MQIFSVCFPVQNDCLQHALSLSRILRLPFLGHSIVFEHGGFGTLVGSWDEYAARGFSARLFLWNGKFSLEKAHTTVLLM